MYELRQTRSRTRRQEISEAALNNLEKIQEIKSLKSQLYVRIDCKNMSCFDRENIPENKHSIEAGGNVNVKSTGNQDLDVKIPVKKSTIKKKKSTKVDRLYVKKKKPKSIKSRKTLPPVQEFVTVAEASVTNNNEIQNVNDQIIYRTNDQISNSLLDNIVQLPEVTENIPILNYEIRVKEPTKKCRCKKRNTCCLDYEILPPKIQITDTTTLSKNLFNCQESNYYSPKSSVPNTGKLSPDSHFKLLNSPLGFNHSTISTNISTTNENYKQQYIPIICKIPLSKIPQSTLSKITKPSITKRGRPKKYNKTPKNKKIKKNDDDYTDSSRTITAKSPSLANKTINRPPLNNPVYYQPVNQNHNNSSISMPELFDDSPGNNDSYEAEINNAINNEVTKSIYRSSFSYHNSTIENISNNTTTSEDKIGDWLAKNFDLEPLGTNYPFEEILKNLDNQSKNLQNSSAQQQPEIISEENGNFAERGLSNYQHEINDNCSSKSSEISCISTTTRTLVLDLCTRPLDLTLSKNRKENGRSEYIELPLDLTTNYQNSKFLGKNEIFGDLHFLQNQINSYEDEVLDLSTKDRNNQRAHINNMINDLQLSTKPSTPKYQPEVLDLSKQIQNEKTVNFLSTPNDKSPINFTKTRTLTLNSEFDFKGRTVLTVKEYHKSRFVLNAANNLNSIIENPIEKLNENSSVHETPVSTNYSTTCESNQTPLSSKINHDNYENCCETDLAQAEDLDDISLFAESENSFISDIDEKTINDENQNENLHVTRDLETPVIVGETDCEKQKTCNSISKNSNEPSIKNAEKDISKESNISATEECEDSTQKQKSQLSLKSYKDASSIKRIIVNNSALRNLPPSIVSNPGTLFGNRTTTSPTLVNTNQYIQDIPPPPVLNSGLLYNEASQRRAINIAQHNFLLNQNFVPPASQRAINIAHHNLLINHNLVPPNFIQEVHVDPAIQPVPNFTQTNFHENITQNYNSAPICNSNFINNTSAINFLPLQSQPNSNLNCSTQSKSDFIPSEIFVEPPPSQDNRNSLHNTSVQFWPYYDNFKNMDNLRRREILKIFNNPCIRYLRNGQTCVKLVCEFTHKLLEPKHLLENLQKRSIDVVDGSYQFVLESDMLFRRYFHVFCEIYGRCNMMCKLKIMIRHCEGMNRPVGYYVHIINGFLLCNNITKRKSIEILLQHYTLKSFDAYNVIIELILDFDLIIEFLTTIQLYFKESGYIPRVEDFNRLLQISYNNRHIPLVRMLLEILKDLPGDFVKELNVHVLTNFLKMVREDIC